MQRRIGAGPWWPVGGFWGALGALCVVVRRSPPRSGILDLECVLRPAGSVISRTKSVVRYGRRVTARSIALFVARRARRDRRRLPRVARHQGAQGRRVRRARGDGADRLRRHRRVPAQPRVRPRAGRLRRRVHHRLAALGRRLRRFPARSLRRDRRARVPDRCRDHHVFALRVRFRARDSATDAPRPPIRPGRRPHRSPARAARRARRADPFAREVVAVPTRGMERWLTQRLSNALGICANVDFPFPRRLTGDGGGGRVGDRPGRGPVAAGAARVAAAGGGRGVARRAVAGGRSPSIPGRAGSRAVRHLAEPVRPLRAAPARSCWTGEHWQARAVAAAARADRGARPGRAGGGGVRAAAGRAGRRRAAGAGLAVRPHAAARPAQLHVLRALAEHRDVHLFLLHPSPALWERIAASRARVTRRADDPTARLPRNRLLGVLGAGLARAAARARAGRRRARAPGRSTRPARCSPAAGRGARGPRRRSPGRPTAASRSTPATAARARSRSCATRSCTCSRPTRRWSRAT